MVWPRLLVNKQRIPLGVRATLTVFSVVWLPLRVHRRGAFGMKASGAVRSLHALLLGLGGWFVGVLVALTLLPTVPVTDEVLALVSIAIPIALAIHWASMPGAQSQRSSLARFVATLVGAIVGGWLAFNVISTPLASLLAIVGATAGANLVVLGLDIRRDHAAREPAIAVTAPAPAEASA